MEDFIKPTLRKDPENIIIHVGTNDINSREPRLTAEGIINLALQIEGDAPSTSIAISGFNLTHLNRVGLHLCKSGTALLAENFCKYIDYAIVDGSTIIFLTHRHPQIARSKQNANGKSVFGRGLVMACLNRNSLVSHIDDLRVFMSQFKDIDNLTINETKLYATIKDGEVHPPGYDVVRKDCESNGRNGGGVCIYVRSNINFQLCADLSPNNLECLTVEITKPRSKPLLLPTWYRPPRQASPDFFSTFERIIDKIDAENLDLYLMCDLNCNLLSEVISNNSSHLLNIIDIYGPTQLIRETTRVTQYSSTLIDLCLTNSPDKIWKSGVISFGISDHSASYLTRKVTHLRSNMHKTVEVRQLKNFNETEFLRDLHMIDWNRVTTYNNPNEMWVFWKHLLASVIDKHAPFRTKRNCCVKYIKEIF